MRMTFLEPKFDLDSALEGCKLFTLTWVNISKKWTVGNPVLHLQGYCYELDPLMTLPVVSKSSMRAITNCPVTEQGGAHQPRFRAALESVVVVICGGLLPSSVPPVSHGTLHSWSQTLALVACDRRPSCVVAK
jgi:hypothetical protein